MATPAKPPRPPQAHQWGTRAAGLGVSQLLEDLGLIGGFGFLGATLTWFGVGLWGAIFGTTRNRRDDATDGGYLIAFLTFMFLVLRYLGVGT